MNDDIPVQHHPRASPQIQLASVDPAIHFDIATTGQGFLPGDQSRHWVRANDRSATCIVTQVFREIRARCRKRQITCIDDTTCAHDKPVGVHEEVVAADGRGTGDTDTPIKRAVNHRRRRAVYNADYPLGAAGLIHIDRLARIHIELAERVEGRAITNGACRNISDAAIGIDNRGRYPVGHDHLRIGLRHKRRRNNSPSHEQTRGVRRRASQLRGECCGLAHGAALFL